jgi:hypothetical protein
MKRHARGGPQPRPAPLGARTKAKVIRRAIRLILMGLGLFVVGIFAIAYLVGIFGGGGRTPPPSQEGQGQQQEDSKQQAPKAQNSEPPSDEVRISGTDGIAVTCTIDDSSGSRSVDLKVPDSIPLKLGGFLSYAGASCQKQGTAGTLTIAIVVAGKVEAKQTTTAQYGQVVVSAEMPR